MVLAAIGANAFWLLYLWLGSAIGASWLSNYKGYGEKVGLGTGLLLSIIGVIVWLLSSATRREFGVEALVLAVAAMFYLIRRTGGQI